MHIELYENLREPMLRHATVGKTWVSILTLSCLSHHMQAVFADPFLEIEALCLSPSYAEQSQAPQSPTANHALNGSALWEIIGSTLFCVEKEKSKPGEPVSRQITPRTGAVQSKETRDVSQALAGFISQEFNKREHLMRSLSPSVEWFACARQSDYRSAFSAIIFTRRVGHAFRHGVLC